MTGSQKSLALLAALSYTQSRQGRNVHGGTLGSLLTLTDAFGFYYLQRQ